MFVGVLALSTTIILVIVLIRLKIKLGIVMLSGAIVISLFARLPLTTVFKTMMSSIADQETIKLMLMVTGLTALGHLLKFTGSLDDIINNLRAIIRDIRVLIALIPALIGLLAVTGGAVMSVPLIEPMGDEVGLNKNDIAVANIVFRHINTFVSPMCTGLILMSSISGIDIIEFIKFNVPIMIIAIPLAFFYIFRNIKPVKVKKERITPKILMGLSISLFPFILIVTLGIGFHIYFPLAFLIGILYTIFFVKTDSNYKDTVKRRFIAAFSGIKWDMVFAAAGVMVFKDVVSITGFLKEISAFLTGTGIPLIVLAILFPLTAGLIMGNSNAAIGLSLPLFLTIVPTDINTVAYYNLIFIASAVGYVISPLHLCILLTVEYCNASLYKVLREVALFGSGVLLIALIRFAIIV